MARAPAIPGAVAAVLATYPKRIRARLLEVRELIFATAAASDVVGELTETLRWGEPAYLTAASKSGTTIRLGWKESDPTRCAIYVNCRTTLVDAFRSWFPGELSFGGNRAILLDEAEAIPTEVLTVCINAALTYHHSGRPPARARRRIPAASRARGSSGGGERGGTHRLLEGRDERTGAPRPGAPSIWRIVHLVSSNGGGRGSVPFIGRKRAT